MQTTGTDGFAQVTIGIHRLNNSMSLKSIELAFLEDPEDAITEGKFDEEIDLDMDNDE